MDDINALVGMTEQEAVEWARMRYMTIRPLSIDGEPQMGDCGHNITRINVDVVGGKISHVIGRG